MAPTQKFGRAVPTPDAWIAARLVRVDELASRFEGPLGGAVHDARPGEASSGDRDVGALVQEVGHLALGLPQDEWARIQEGLMTRVRLALDTTAPGSLLGRVYLSEAIEADEIATSPSDHDSKARLTELMISRFQVGCFLEGLEVIWRSQGEAAARLCLHERGVEAWDLALERAIAATRLLPAELADFVDPVAVRPAVWLGAASPFFADQDAPAASLAARRSLSLLFEDRLRMDYGPAASHGWEVEALDDATDVLELRNRDAARVGVWIKPLEGGSEGRVAWRRAQEWEGALVCSLRLFESYVGDEDSVTDDEAETGGSQLVAQLTLLDFDAWVSAESLKSARMGDVVSVGSATQELVVNDLSDFVGSFIRRHNVAAGGDVNPGRGRVVAFPVHRVGGRLVFHRSADAAEDSAGRLAALSSDLTTSAECSGSLRVSLLSLPSGDIAVTVTQDEVAVAAMSVEFFVSSGAAEPASRADGCDGVAVIKQVDLSEAKADSRLVIKLTGDPQ